MKVRLCIVAMFLPLLLSAQKFDLSDVISKRLNKDSVKNDLRILYGILNEFHPGEFMHCSEQEFIQYYDSLYESVKDDVSFLIYYQKVSSLIAKIRDGHTDADKSIIRKAIQDRPVFPFRICKIEDSYYLASSADEKYDSLIGKRIEKINGNDISEIGLKVRSVISTEGRNESGFNYSMQQFPFYYFMIDTSVVYTLEYEWGNNRSSVMLQGIPYKTYISKTRRIVEPVSVLFEENHFAVLTMNTFLAEDFKLKKLNYKKFLDGFFQEIRKRKITNLLIDVRGNSGGSPEVSNYLLSYLLKHKYYYFEYVGKKYCESSEYSRYCLSPQLLQMPDISHTEKRNSLYCEVPDDKKNYWWFEEQKIKKYSYQGDLITLIDGGCFSTTGHFIAMLKNYGVGALAGECSQGSYYSNGGALTFQLPYTGLKINIPTAQFQLRLNNFNYDPQGICPDTIIQKSVTDFNGTDTQLNKILTAMRYR